ncbi:MAG: antitoxin VapB family protein, partial [Candidatus Helarchaeota archaeon]
ITVKTITMKEEVQNKLMFIKNDESFSELFMRLLENKNVKILTKIRNKLDLNIVEKKNILKEIDNKRFKKR